jgi:hypothetical protein
LQLYFALCFFRIDIDILLLLSFIQGGRGICGKKEKELKKTEKKFDLAASRRISCLKKEQPARRNENSLNDTGKR